MKYFTVLIFALPLRGLAVDARAAGLAPATEAAPAPEMALESNAAGSKDPLAGLDFQLAEPPAMGGPDVPEIEHLPVLVDPAWSEESEAEYRLNEGTVPDPAPEPYEPLNRVTLPF